MNNDLISREALKEEVEKYLEKRQDVIVWESDIYNIYERRCKMTDKEREEFIKRWKETQPLRPALLTDMEWKSSLESYVLGYESPITLIAKEMETQMETQMEGDVVNVVQQYGINVNKEELLKALMYDRDQYAKGYAKGRRDFERPKGEWNYIQVGMAVCPFCGANPHKDYKNFCPKCGADMRSGEAGEENDNDG